MPRRIPYSGESIIAPSAAPGPHRRGLMRALLHAMTRIGLFDGVGLRQALVTLGDLHQPLVVLVERARLALGEILHVDQAVAGAGQRGHDLVELEVNRLGILVLRSLNQEDHEERDDRRPGVDDELPGIGEVEPRSAGRPHENHRPCDAERPGSARRLRDPVRQPFQQPAEGARRGHGDLNLAVVAGRAYWTLVYATPRAGPAHAHERLALG